MPEKVWLRVLKNLEVKDVNNVHLVCRSLHQIAKLHVNPKLRLAENSPKDLESLVQSSRIFEELQFLEQYGAEDHWLDQKKFKMIEKFIKFTGSHVKKLFIKNQRVDPKFFQLLNLLPNLEALELNYVQIRASEGSIKWTLKSRKIMRIKMIDCSSEIESLLGSLEECVIEEVELGFSSKTKPEVVEKFLKSQEKNLRKLTIATDLNMPNNLKDLRLEYLEINNYCQGRISLEFLRHQKDLKFLKLILNFVVFSNQDLSMICELKQLEILELYGRAVENSGLNKLYQLENLKRLAVDPNISRNILDHLKFGVFNDLEELNACFEGASVESIQEMKRISPNLKKIKIQYATSDTINALLETLESLESVKTQCEKWETSSEKVHPNLKHLVVFPTLDSEFTAAQLAHRFPNLEFLTFDQIKFEVTESSFVTLLNGLKRLKTLVMGIRSDTKLKSDFILPCFEKFGKHLEEVHVSALEDRNFLQSHIRVVGFRIEKEPNEGFRFNQIFDI